MSSSAMKPICYSHDTLDNLTNFFKDTPKDCIKTLRYTAEWATGFFKKMEYSSPLLKTVTQHLKEGTSIFVMPEWFQNINTFRINSGHYLFGGKKISRSEWGFSGLDAFSKSCDLCKWFQEKHIIFLQPQIAAGLATFSGISLTLTFLNKTYKAHQDISSCHYQDRNYHLLKTIKYTALACFGMLLTGLSIGLKFDPTYILLCSTISLISSYATYRFQHPVGIPAKKV